MPNSLVRYIATFRYLKFSQIFYRIYYITRNKTIGYTKIKNTKASQINSLLLINSISKNNSYTPENTFTFLNKTKKFKKKIDWDFDAYGKLWTYNLNYFEFLNQKEISVQEGINLIYEFINADNIKTGLEPYPISLRGVEWIKFLTYNKIEDKRISNNLFAQYKVLIKNIEYHILGNHLFENGISLLFASYYFNNTKFFAVAKKILKKQLNEQILKDGAHFEKSPMYHQIILFRILDAINLIINNKKIFFDNSLYVLLLEKAQIMLAWLKNITFANGEIPYFNDSTPNIAPTTKQLLNYSQQLKIQTIDIKLGDSGFRKISKKNYEIIIDFGEIKANYQPGHSHSGMFSFCLNINDKPVIVDTGISTYENNSIRKFERSTKAHNTVVINNKNPIDVWSSFRVGKRAEIIKLKENNNTLLLVHNGYKKYHTIHSRHYTFYENSIFIKDLIKMQKIIKAKSYIHFHPDIKIKKDKNLIISDEFEITFKNYKELSVNSYNFASGYNNRTKSTVIIIEFDTELETIIKIN